MHTPDEIRSFLSRAQPGDGIGLDLRGDMHVAGKFIAFDGETVRLDLEGTSGESSYTIERIRRAVIEFTSEGPE